MQGLHIVQRFRAVLSSVKPADGHRHHQLRPAAEGLDVRQHRPGGLPLLKHGVCQQVGHILQQHGGPRRQVRLPHGIGQLQGDKAQARPLGSVPLHPPRTLVPPGQHGGDIMPSCAQPCG
ncbi:hypothetical protein SDC9_208198 [bioreactor metagenome]|uniref:Uncharacterized protein n=1 Tax=bioreactor metagenome TaxID=1076179 RepID=A0A645JBL4_9ZZZZ